ncbi:hypothetical protein [Bradyrhizobium paxllaeri]|uniref:hypothetical protein n=1 Tax=Bradyrhizobium paxllaeri TaxID=190148 RepID=UPI00081099E0|nr:hypothetical protein [Bradyrhizobium paxllaeri]
MASNNQTNFSGTIEPIEPMKTLPKFVDGAQYHIKVARAVELAPGLWARPASPKVVVSGAKARELGDVVIWAMKL